MKAGPVVRIRPARATDAATMAALSGQLGYPTEHAAMLERLRAVDGRSDHAVLVAEEDGHVRGWIHVFGAHHIESDATAEIGGLVVADGARSRGLGAALVAAGEEWAVSQGFPRMRVRSNIVRERAHRFYERHGYARTKQSFVFSKTLPPR